MPISDLLASIGGPPSGPVPSVAVRPTAGIKRKADDDLRQPMLKAQRPLNVSLGAPKPTVLPRRSHTAPLPQTAIPGRSTGSMKSRMEQDLPRTSTPSSNSIKAQNPSRPTATTQNGAAAPPKKGSFAEILARGRQAQAVMGQVGRLQHKKAEKGAIPKKEKDEPTAVNGKTRKSITSRPGYAGNARPASAGGPSRGGASNIMKNGTSNTIRDLARGNANSMANIRNGGIGSRQAGPGKKKQEVEPMQKIKKAATATTGYTGTSRPKPGAPTSSKNGKEPRGGALLNQPKPRSRPSGRSRHHDEYDDEEELDDFIEYDDEEDAGGAGPRYDYASDGSSDMEAGLDDIDDEERQAEYIARKEDIEEQRLEQNLKMAKEDRKRRALEELRASKRR